MSCLHLPGRIQQICSTGALGRSNNVVHSPHIIRSTEYRIQLPRQPNAGDHAHHAHQTPLEKGANRGTGDDGLGVWV